MWAELFILQATQQTQNLGTALSAASRGHPRADQPLNPTQKHPWASVLGRPETPAGLRFLFFSYTLLVRACEGGPCPPANLELLSPGSGDWHEKHPPNLGYLEGMGEGPPA